MQSCFIIFFILDIFQSSWYSFILIWFVWENHDKEHCHGGGEGGEKNQYLSGKMSMIPGIGSRAGKDKVRGVVLGETGGLGGERRDLRGRECARRPEGHSRGICVWIRLDTAMAAAAVRLWQRRPAAQYPASHLLSSARLMYTRCPWKGVKRIDSNSGILLRWLSSM